MHTVMDRAVAQTSALFAPVEDQTLYVQALASLRNGAPDEAAFLLIQTLRRQPEHLGMQRNLVRALLAAGRFSDVLIQANAALAATPDSAELHFARGTALNALGESSRACAAFARALSLQPDHAESWLNMGNASADLDDLTSAETLYRTALRLNPALAEAYASLGYVLTLKGDLTAAIKACEAAVRLRPEFAQAHWNLAVALLLSGDMPRGFAEYEWRKQHPQFRRDFPKLPGMAWDGSDPAGRTILVRAEQGLGDTIQFARYLPMIRAAGGIPILICAPPLVQLLRTMPGVQIVSTLDPVPNFDVWIDQMSLPRVFGTELNSIPAGDRYLSYDLVRAEAWRARLPDGMPDGMRDGMRVGIALAGNAKHPADRRRSIPLDLAGSLTDIPGMSFVNLQHGDAARTLGLPDLTRWMTDYTETAALIGTLDIVITVDTSVAHLAGALGKPVWLLLAHAPDWRWLLGRTDSPWYQSMRLFRQESPGDWEDVLDRVRQELRDHGGRQSIPIFYTSPI
jgi:tetratricopeptide (TPR) repeat protein